MDDAPSRALQAESPELLVAGLTRLLQRGEQQWLVDWRDLLTALAPYHDAARRLGSDIPTLFSQAADAGPEALRGHVRRFGRRRDVTLEAFGWVLRQSEDGPAYHFTG